MNLMRLVDSPIGPLRLVARACAITGLYLPDHAGMPPIDAVEDPGDRTLALAAAQLAEYFAGARLGFDLPLAAAGTSFQRRVWEELCRIPPATTISYGELARRVGKPHAARAVGTANARNPISIVVPCHRVIGQGGTLTGYAGGIAAKRWLLDHEAATAGRCDTRRTGSSRSRSTASRSPTA